MPVPSVAGHGVLCFMVMMFPALRNLAAALELGIPRLVHRKSHVANMIYIMMNISKTIRIQRPLIMKGTTDAREFWKYKRQAKGAWQISETGEATRKNIQFKFGNTPAEGSGRKLCTFPRDSVRRFLLTFIVRGLRVQVNHPKSPCVTTEADSLVHDILCYLGENGELNNIEWSFTCDIPFPDYVDMEMKNLTDALAAVNRELSLPKMGLHLAHYMRPKGQVNLDPVHQA
jgi:hypothetical protein